MGDHPTPVPARELSAEEIAELRHRSFELDIAIKKLLVAKRTGELHLSRYLYEFHSESAWRFVGCHTLNEWLAQPEVGLSRSEFFCAVQIWDRLIEPGRVAVKDLEGLPAGKIQKVIPAILNGNVEADDAIDDVKALGWRDLRQKYEGQGQRRKSDSPTSGDEDPEGPLDADQEPERMKCPVCGSWVDADVIDSTAEEEPDDG